MVPARSRTSRSRVPAPSKRVWLRDEYRSSVGVRAIWSRNDRHRLPISAREVGRYRSGISRHWTSLDAPSSAGGLTAVSAMVRVRQVRLARARGIVLARARRGGAGLWG